MKIAILILAHKNKEQLEKLIKHLNVDFDVFIHIDRNSNLKLEKTERVTEVKQYRVFWGSYNQIIATVELFITASENNYDRYILISGQDIPVKSNKDIIKYFETRKDVEYLEYEKLPKSNWSNGGFNRLEYYCPNVVNRKVDRKPDIVFMLSIISRIIFELIRKCQKKYPIFRRKISNNFYGGANWMELTNGSVKYICEFLKNNKAYLKRFKFTRCADEIFFQTIILNSSFSKRCENKCLRYMDWNSGSEHPKILKSDDLEKIFNSEALFARKFDEKIDNKVIEKIYHKIK